MSTLRSGNARGDLTLHDGCPPLDFIRSIARCVFAYDAEGKPVGVYVDLKAAQNGSCDQPAGKAGSS